MFLLGKYKIKDMRGILSIKGLMFDSSDIDGALISGNSIWMPFVKYPLYLYFLDEGYRVLKKMYAVPMTLNPKTWKVYSCKEASFCLEMKTKLNVKIGQRLNLKKIGDKL